MRSLLSFFLRSFLFFSILSSSAALSHAADGKTLQIKGSDTMVNLGQAWVEAFMEKNPQVSIAVTGGGSGTGISSILAGTCDLAQSSRDLTAEEKKKAEEKGSPIKETVVAYDGIAVITHPDNPVSQLTIEQLAGIFSGKITNWKEVGGKDLPILTLSRERNSGTHVFFLEHVVRQGNAKGPEEFSTSTLMMPSSQAIVDEVKSSESAIGYVGLGYVTEEEKVIAVAKATEGPYLQPSIQTVLDGTYAVARPLLFLTRGEPAGEIKQLVDFVTSSEGQAIVEALDFIPLKQS